MSLRENRIIDGEIKVYDKVQVAIDRLKAFEPPEGYWLAFSGGKDSVALKGVADLSGVKYEAHYSLTTVDPPELVYFIKTFDDVTIDKPRLSMWRLIEEKGTPPLRMSRYCCSELKESNGNGRVVLTGVRWAESVRRKKHRNLVDIGEYKVRQSFHSDNEESRRAVEQCYRTRQTLVNPIIDWSDDDVWQFIREQKLPYCSLYDEGFKRLGCIGCPMSGYDGMKRDFERWPTYQRAYITAFNHMNQKRKDKGMPIRDYLSSGQECFDWWVGNNKKDDDTFDGQIDMEEL